MGQNIKTAISIEENLFEQVKKLASELRIPRSRVFSIAVKELIKKRDSEKLLRQINDAYTEETPEEIEVREGHRKKHIRVLSEETI